MKLLEKEVELFRIFLLLLIYCNVVLTGNENRDITTEGSFGCEWSGGSNVAVVCSCRDEYGRKDMYIKANSIPSYDTAEVKIRNCQKVIFGPESISNMRNLRLIDLENIENIEFEQTSIKWYGYREVNNYEEAYDQSIPSLKIHIKNSHINKISSYTFEGRINEINFENVIIENIEAFAFNSLLQTGNIIIKNSLLKNIKLQAFKKFTTENLILDGVSTQLVPSRFFANITVNENLIIKNCSFDTVRPSGFLIFNPKRFEVTDTRINHLDGEAFKVIVRGDVLFQNNQFNVINDGAFEGITPNNDEIAKELTITFNSNTFATLTRDSLQVNGLTPKFSALKINEECDCTSISHNIKDADFYTDIMCLYDGEFITVKDYKLNMCSIIASHATTIIIISTVSGLCILVGATLFLYYKKVYLSKKYGSEKQSKKGNMSLIVPDGRTYRETELHVIVERADLLTTDL